MWSNCTKSIQNDTWSNGAPVQDLYVWISSNPGEITLWYVNASEENSPFQQPSAYVIFPNLPACKNKLTVISVADDLYIAVCTIWPPEICCMMTSSKWKHFPRYWPFVLGIHRWPVNSPHKGRWRGVLMFSLICAWINGWVNNRGAGDLRHNRAHYDVTVMC